MYFPDDAEGMRMRKKLTANTAVFAKALRNFLRGAAGAHNGRTVASDSLRIPVRAVAHTHVCIHLAPPSGPSDDATFRSEMMSLVDQGLMSEKQVDATMAAKNRWVALPS